MRQFGGSTYLDLNDQELAEIMRPVRGQGGIQDFMRHLQSRVNSATKTIRLDNDDLENIPHYAFDYGQGGFEDRLTAAFSRELGPNLGRDDDPKS
jgi:hypothetical protein